MGINRGLYNGIGVNPLLGQQFVGTVTIRPTEEPNTVALSIQDTPPGRRGAFRQLLQIYDEQGSPIFAVDPGGQTDVYGDWLGAYSLGAIFGVSSETALNGKTNPPSIVTGPADNPTTNIYFGNNTPTGANFPFLRGVTNDWFFNFAGTTSTTHMYRCSTTGTPGTWVGFA